MGIGLFQYGNQKVTAMAGDNNRYVIYLGSEAVTTVIKAAKQIYLWQDKRYFSTTLTDAAYQWLRRNRG